MIPEYIHVYKNEKKSEKAPDFRMMAEVEGVYKEIAVGWQKTTQGGVKYISFSRSKPKEKVEQTSAEMKENSPFID